MVVTIHVGGIGVGDGLVQGDWSFDGFVFGVEDFRDVALQLISFRLHVLDREADHCASHLHGHSVLSFQA